MREYKPDGRLAEVLLLRAAASALWSKYPDTGEVGERPARHSSTRATTSARSGARTSNYACEWEPLPDDGLERFPEAKPR